MYSFVIYSITFVLMFWFSTFLKNNKTACIGEDIRFKSWNAIIILIFTIVFGLRYNVGVDYQNYKELYDTNNFERLEFLFRGISNLFVKCNIHVVWYFTLWVFLQIFFLIKAFEKEKYIYPALVFTLFTGQYFLLWMNVIRQDIAACIFIFSISFIVKRYFWKFTALILIACGFHKTAILLFLAYPLFQLKKNYFNNIYLQLLILLVAAYFGLNSNSIMTTIDSILQPFLMTFDYEEYSYGGLEESFANVALGFTFLSSFVLDLIIIVYSKKMKSYYHNDRFLCFYDLYYFGVITNLLLAQSYILLRPVRYFRFFKMIISAYLLYYLYKHGKSHINLMAFIVTVMLYVILYLAIFRYSADAYYIYHIYPF